MNDISFEIPFNNAAEGMIVVDHQGVIVQVNNAAQRMFGYQKPELQGNRIEILVPVGSRDKHVHNRADYVEKPHTRPMGKGMDLLARRKDGSEFPVEISLSPFSFEEENYVLAFVVDITEKKQAEAKLEEYYTNLEKEVEKRTLILSEAVMELEKTKGELHDALSKEKKLNDLKSRFVSMVSHEFRTPLATVQSSLDLAERYLEQEDAEKQKKHFGRIRTALSGLTAILNDVLSLGKLEEGKITLSPALFHFREFMEELMDEMQALAKVGQYINLDLSGGAEQIYLDKNILRQMIINLVSNAIKFSPEGTPIEVNAALRQNDLIISVQDNGIGIPEEDQKNLFKSFFRGQNASTIQGTGLGLNIVLKYVQLLQGGIDFSSKQGDGTRFEMRIPLAMPDEVSQES